MKVPASMRSAITRWSRGAISATPVTAGWWCRRPRSTAPAALSASASWVTSGSTAQFSRIGSPSASTAAISTLQVPPTDEGSKRKRPPFSRPSVLPWM